jgi:hypothetical protein
MRFPLLTAAAIITAATTCIALAQRAPDRPPVLAENMKLMPVDWAELQSALKNQQLPRPRFQQLKVAGPAQQPSLPMLLPFEPSIAAGAAHLFPQPHSYSASLRQGDITVEVHGDRRALQLSPKDAMARLMQVKQQTVRLAGANTPVSIERTEGGYDITFNRFGAAYLVAVECKNPETDERCTKPDFVRGLAERLGLVGADRP